MVVCMIVWSNFFCTGEMDLLSWLTSFAICWLEPKSWLKVDCKLEVMISDMNFRLLLMVKCICLLSFSGRSGSWKMVEMLFKTIKASSCCVSYFLKNVTLKKFASTFECFCTPFCEIVEICCRKGSKSVGHSRLSISIKIATNFSFISSASSRMFRVPLARTFKMKFWIFIFCDKSVEYQSVLISFSRKWSPKKRTCSGCWGWKRKAQISTTCFLIDGSFLNFQQN